jgi:hypothetical protein
MLPSVSKLAKDAGADRSMLYRAFRREKGPRLSLVVRVLSSAGFQLIVNADRETSSKRQTQSHQCVQGCEYGQRVGSFKRLSAFFLAYGKPRPLP